MPKGVSAETQRRINHLNGRTDELVVHENQRGLCDGLAEAFADYDDVLDPLTYQAQATCAECPLLLLCRARARVDKPAWGVWGGEVWSNDGSPDEYGRIVRRQRVQQLVRYVALEV